MTSTLKTKRRVALCECGCGQTGDRRQMVSVRRTDGRTRRVGRTLVRRARSWQVLPGCRKAFERELHLTQECTNLALGLGKAAWWKRVPFLPRLWLLRSTSLRRRQGQREARRRAWALVWTVLRR